MFSNCDTIPDIIVKARELKKEGKDPGEVNVQANARRRLLVSLSTQSENLLEKKRIKLRPEELQLKAPLPFKKDHGNKPIFEVTSKGSIVI